MRTNPVEGSNGQRTRTIPHGPENSVDYRGRTVSRPGPRKPLGDLPIDSATVLNQSVQNSGNLPRALAAGGSASIHPSS